MDEEAIDGPPLTAVAPPPSSFSRPKSFRSKSFAPTFASGFQLSERSFSRTTPVNHPTLSRSRIEPHPIHQSPPGSTTASSTALVRVEHLRKEYSAARGRLVLFEDLSFSVFSGESVAIIGESGAGKSTLLHILGALDAPSGGNVYCDEILLNTLTPTQAASFRNRQLGYIWQFHYLLPEFSALENVAMPLLARGEASSSALAKARHWLHEVELEDRADHRSGELSGGEQQRVSLARALVTNPRLLLADEPTGDLDNRTATLVFDLIHRLQLQHQLTSILVTHNQQFAQRCDRVLRLENGRLEEISPSAV